MVTIDAHGPNKIDSEEASKSQVESLIVQPHHMLRGTGGHTTSRGHLAGLTASGIALSGPSTTGAGPWVVEWMQKIDTVRF